MEEELIKEAGLTQGESKVYLALLNLGLSSTGPIVKRSGISRSFISNILYSLKEKGLVSYVKKGEVTYYQAESPERIILYLQKKQEQLENSKNNLVKLLPALDKIKKETPKTEIQVYDGFKGIQTAFEHCETKLSAGEEYFCLGGPGFQQDKYHTYWKEHHKRRIKLGIKAKMLFNTDTPKSVIDDRNSYKWCDTRYMPTDIRTKSWIFVYKDTTGIFLQEETSVDESFAIEIVNQKIADTFKAYFEDYWKLSKLEK
jgi:HTH-type transcriptional regulator, sugar sensing transcriptional regulator